MVTTLPLLLILLEAFGLAVIVGLILTLSTRALMKSARFSNREKLTGAFLILGLVPLLGKLALDYLLQASPSAGASLLYAGSIAAADLILAIRIAQQYFQPVARLTAGIIQAAKTGKPVSSNIQSEGEWKILAQAIEKMTLRQQEAIRQLQERLDESTRQNQRLADKTILRARQLQTLSDVAQSITASTDLDQLFNTITLMISARFGFYFAGIFLVGENPETAVLRAASSEEGQRLVTRSYQVTAGEVGIVSAALQTGTPKINLDASVEDLPRTRSEMALPLLNGRQVIGAIDLHSDNPNGFAEEDIHLYSVLADQIAIALINNRLYMDMRKALAEAQEIHSHYLRQEWKRESAERRIRAYKYHLGTVQPAEPLTSPEVRAAFSSGEVNSPTNAAESKSQPSAEQIETVGTTLAVPIKLREIVIGVINLQEVDPSRKWTKEEIEMVKSVADQIAVAVENARLLEQTLRRASRERKVFEITSKLRSINDPESMVKAAVAELRSALGADRAQVIIHSLPGVEIQNHGQDSSKKTNNGSTGL